MAESTRCVGATVVKCMECGERFTNGEAGEHTKNTGHNRWELLIPKVGYYTEVCRGVLDSVAHYFLRHNT